jgi:hypothetical protein
LLNSQLLEIFLEVRDAVTHLISGCVQLGVYFVFVNVNFAIFKVLYLLNCLSSTFLV